MKKMIMGITIALLAIVTMAAAPDALPELENFAALKAKSSTRIAGASMYVSGHQINSTNSDPYVLILAEGTPEQVLAEITSKSVSFEPISTNDDMTCVISLNDRNSRVLFTGYSWFKMKKDQNGQWILPAGANVVKDWWLNYWQPIQVGLPGEFYSAALYVYNNNGQLIGVERYSVGEDGVLMFPQDKAGAGILILYGSDGAQLAYDLKDGGKKVTGVVGLQVTADISKLFDTIPETIGTYTSRPQSYNGHGEAKPIRVDVTVRRTINLIGRTSEGENAINVTVLRYGADGLPRVFNARSDGVIPVELEPGQYIMYYGWERGFDSFIPEYYYPDGGGKGG